MTNLKMMIALAALVGSAAAASASPKLTALGCEVENGNFDASLSFRDDSGATYHYRNVIERTPAGFVGSTLLRDAQGRTVASARTVAGSKEREVSFGAGWSQRLGAALRDVMLEGRVQSELESCAAAFPGRDYLPWFCPILLFIWDEDLAGQLCGWMPYPHPW